MATKLIDGQWYEVEWPDGGGTDTGLIINRHDGQYVQFRRYNPVPVSVCLENGYKFTPLVCATPERINALEDIDNLLGELLNSGEIEEWLTPRRIDVIERKREAINAMLREMKGATDDS